MRMMAMTAGHLRLLSSLTFFPHVHDKEVRS